MKLAKFNKKIIKLIGKDNLDDAIRKLHNFLQSHPKTDELVIQSARYNDLKKQIRLGVIDLEKANITKNKIRLALIELLDEIEDYYKDNPEIQKEIAKKATKIKDSGIVAKNVTQKGKYVSGRDIHLKK